MATGAIICEAVLAEACHLAAKDGIAPAKILQLVEENSLTLLSLAQEVSPIRNLLTRYADLQMDFADACVVRLAELHPTAMVCTIDRDFPFYRRNGREA